MDNTIFLVGHSAVNDVVCFADTSEIIIKWNVFQWNHRLFEPPDFPKEFFFSRVVEKTCVCNLCMNGIE